MTQDKAFSRLRPFNLEAAKRGEPICWYDDGERVRYIGQSAAHDGGACVEFLEGECVGQFETYAPIYLRMAPLCWVEGKPVYKGDRLYSTWKDSSPEGFLAERLEPARCLWLEKGTWINPIAFETRHYVFGIDVSTMSSGQLIEAIKRIEGEIADLKAVKTKSKHITEKIKSLDEMLGKVVEQLDAQPA